METDNRVARIASCLFVALVSCGIGVVATMVYYTGSGNENNMDGDSPSVAQTDETGLDIGIKGCVDCYGTTTESDMVRALGALKSVDATTLMIEGNTTPLSISSETRLTKETCQAVSEKERIEIANATADGFAPAEMCTLETVSLADIQVGNTVTVLYKKEDSQLIEIRLGSLKE